MTLEEFRTLIKYSKQFEDYINEANKLHINLFETPMYDAYGELTYKFIWSKEFNDVQIDVIYQWMYECDYGEIPVYVEINDESKYLRTVEELYNFVNELK